MYLHQTVAPRLSLHSRQARLLTWLLIASLLLQPLASRLSLRLATAPATHSNSTGETLPAPLSAPPYALPPEVAGQAEVVALRTSHSAAFKLADGRLALLQDSQPLHYQDPSGDWQPINPTFVADSQGWLNASNSLHTRLALQSSRAHIGTSNLEIGWTPQQLEVVDAAARVYLVASPNRDASQRGTRSRDGRSVTYPASWDLPSVQEQWQSNPGSSEYTLRLTALPTRHWWQPTPQSLDLRVQIELQPGTTLQVDGKTVDFANQSPLSPATHLFL